MSKILDPSECPDWVQYPKLFLELFETEQYVFLPWYLLDETKTIIIRYEGLKNHYPRRKLFPFARRDDNDDIACWEKDKPGVVQIIHDFASPGWEQRQTFDSFEEWYQFALSEKCDEEDE